MSRQESLNLETLADRYDLIGELGSREDVRIFIGKRREDGRDVLVRVASAQAGDKGNALSHLAADANLLAGVKHPNLLSIVDGRWVGTDAFAVVTERTFAPTLREVLSRREEEFTFPRIAAILRDVNAVLVWARERKVVHRSVTLDTLFLEPGSDRVVASFAARPLTQSGVPGPEEDAQNIARLARSMLTRSAAAPERETQPLAELRPGLPAKLVEQTEALLQPPREGVPLVDTNAYIALIAMADAVKHGETHVADTTREMQEQQRIAREQLEAERRAHDELIAKERRAHEQDITEQKNRFDKQREEYERQLAKERKQLAKETEALAKERASHARDRAALLAERAAHERTSTEERQRLNSQSAGLKAQAGLYAQTAELSAATLEPIARASNITPIEVVAPKAEKPAIQAPYKVAERKGWNGERWRVPVALAALVLLIAMAALAISKRRNQSGTEPSELASAAHGSIIDSAGGSVYESVVPLPAVTTDTLALAAAASDWTPPPRRKKVMALVPDSQTTAPRFDVQAEGAPPRDTAAARRDTLVKRDAVVKRDTTPALKRDSVAKIDSLSRRDKR